MNEILDILELAVASARHAVNMTRHVRPDEWEDKHSEAVRKAEIAIAALKLIQLNREVSNNG